MKPAHMCKKKKSSSVACWASLQTQVSPHGLQCKNSKTNSTKSMFTAWCDGIVSPFITTVGGDFKFFILSNVWILGKLKVRALAAFIGTGTCRLTPVKVLTMSNQQVSVLLHSTKCFKMQNHWTKSQWLNPCFIYRLRAKFNVHCVQ